jgi:hypothetical protein
VTELFLQTDHELKCWPQHYGPLWNRVKPFEIRKNDRGFKVGDVLLIREWCPDRSEYTGHHCYRHVTYVTDFAQREGYVVLGLG